MAEYIKREDALKIADEYYDHPIGKDIAKSIFCLPAADVVEVVRCKDCKFFEPDTYSDDWCSAKISGVSKGMLSPNFDSYCSDAVKRGKEDV